MISVYNKFGISFGIPRGDTMERKLLNEKHREEMLATAKLFQSLSNPVRLCIVQQLSERGEMCVSDFCACMDASQPLISKHLNNLKSAGVVRSRNDGQFVRYRLDNETVRAILKAIKNQTEEKE